MTHTSKFFFTQKFFFSPQIFFYPNFFFFHPKMFFIQIFFSPKIFFDPNFFPSKFFFTFKKNFQLSLFYVFLDVLCHPECSKKFSPQMFLGEARRDTMLPSISSFSFLPFFFFFFCRTKLTFVEFGVAGEILDHIDAAGQHHISDQEELDGRTRTHGVAGSCGRRKVHVDPGGWDEGLSELTAGPHDTWFWMRGGIC